VGIAQGNRDEFMIEFGRDGRVFTLAASMVVPRPRGEVFTYFADAGNLETLTPGWLKFEVLKAEPMPMQAGTMIDYRLRLRGVPLKWRSAISAWEPGVRFVDEQRRGRYRVWIHEHTFEDAAGGGTLVRDRVRYDMFGGTVGEPAPGEARFAEDLCVSTGEAAGDFWLSKASVGSADPAVICKNPSAPLVLRRGVAPAEPTDSYLAPFHQKENPQISALAPSRGLAQARGRDFLGQQIRSHARLAI